MTEDQGASPNELMLLLCRNDQEEELEQLLEEGNCDVSFTDGAGNSAAHYAVKAGSIGCLEALVNHDEVDFDIQNTFEGDTPLHLAVKYGNEHEEVAAEMVYLLLAGGADTRISNKNKLTPVMLVNPNHRLIKEKFDESKVVNTVDDADIADDESVGDGEGSGSEEED